MKQGHVKSQINKALLYGAPGTGKSSSMDLFVGNPPRQARISTPLAARPITMIQMGITSKEWKKLHPKERKEILARAIYAQLHANDTNSGEDCESSANSGESSDSDEILTTPEHKEARSKEDKSTRDVHPRVHPATPSSPTSASKPKKGSHSKEKISLPSLGTHDELTNYWMKFPNQMILKLYLSSGKLN